ncbi:MAG: hypothetical protein Q7S31_02665 [bacterium]|nr:hypothetical protein [bacterium]
MKKLLTVSYILILAIPLFTWLRGYNSQGGLYEFMRLAGLFAFTLLFLQLTIGAFMSQLRPVFGIKILRWHIIQGIIAFTVAWTHPTLYMLQFGFDQLWRLGGYYIWGKVGLTLLTFAVAAGLLRTAPFLVKYWRWVHRLNYLTLVIIYVHSWHVGSDTHTFPMTILYLLIPLVWTSAIYLKLRSSPRLATDGV